MNATISNATINSAANNFAGFSINTYKLAGQFPQFQFAAAPRFLTEKKWLSSDAKLLYAFYNSRAGQKGYVENYTRGQIADKLGLSLSRFKRALAELTSNHLILSLQRGNGAPNAYVLLPHQDMELPEKELIARRIDLPPKIRRLIEQAKKRASGGSSVSHQGGSGGSRVSQPMYIKDTTKNHIQEQARPMPSTASSIITDQPVASALNPEPTVESNHIEAEPKSAPLPTNNSVETTGCRKKTKVRKPKSRHSLELCLRFAKAEKDRKGSIEDVQAFGEACYWTGRHDREIERWLRKKAAAMVGQYMAKTVTTVKPVADQSAPAQSAQTTSADPAEVMRELQRARELEALRAQAFDKLSPDEQQQRIKAKLGELMNSEHHDKFKRMTQDKLLEHAVNQVKKELVPY